MTSLATATAENTVESESFLLGRARRGDTRAFEILYRDYSGRVHGLCLRLTGGDRAAAEDATQETFINAWRALGRFEARASFGTWLHRIAVNVVMKKRRRLSASHEITMDPADFEADWQLDTPVEVSELEAAIAGLPEGARDAVVLYGIYGYSHEETAGMMGVAQGTCRAQLHRARKLIRERLQVEVR
jgi:RNA polymerase sigma-70 factor (ECF subfamily)